MIHDRKGKKSLLMFPTNRQNTEKRKGERAKDRKKRELYTHTTFVSDKSLFCARLIFCKNNDNENEEKSVFFFFKNLSRIKKNHEHKMTCNEEMLLIHVCV